MQQKNLLSASERTNWLRLIRSQNVGAKTFISLITTFGSATAALESIDELAKRGGNKKTIKIATTHDIEAELEKVEAYGAQIILSCDGQYSQLLKTTDDHPAVITVKGNIELLHKKTIAIVGARNASMNGRNFAKNLAHDLTAREIMVASGLARGIDTSAHIGCKNAQTIAVIAGGIDHIYPQENTALYESIAESGLIVSELPIGSAPLASNFPQRNRIISGLSLATAVVEAAKKSGSLITANYAKAHGRQIFAMPGSPLDPRSGGTNALIKAGAILLESAEDIINFMEKSPQQASLFSESNENYSSPETQLPTETELSKFRPKVWEMINFTPCLAEDIIEELHIPTSVFNLLILELELAGKIERLYGNRVVRIS